MHEAFLPLVARVRPLGNSTRKYLRAIERGGEAFVSGLEPSGVLAHVHLDRTSPSIVEDFARIAAAGRGSEEQLRLLGTYFAVQLLHQNARTLEQLALDLAERSGRQAAYGAFLERNEAQFAQLVSTYVEQVLRLVTPVGAGPFVILNVGTPAHQDDIDMAVVHDGSGNRAGIDRAVARLASQCQRYASPLDNYFAAEVGVTGFCLGLAELQQALVAGGIGFVLVTELLRAERVAGEQAVLERLRREVTAEYCYRRRCDNDRHELYLRGILGESRSLLLRPPASGHLNPKDDALRLIIGLTIAFKTIDCLDETQPGAILARLKLARPGLHEPLVKIEESLIFIETFGQITQLLVTLDEEVAIEDRSARENLERIAQAMGYRSRGPVSAVEHLLVHYHEAIEDAHRAAEPLMEAVAQHLTRKSRYSRWTRGRPPEDYARKLANILVAAARAFRSVRFYDDLIEAFAAPSGAVLGAFVASFSRLAGGERCDLARQYAIWGCEAPYTFMTLVVLIARREAPQAAARVCDELIDAFLRQLAGSTEVEAVRAVARVFRAFPVLGNRFLFLLDPERLARFDAALDVGIANPEVAAARDGYRLLIGVHRRTSRYIRRVIARVTERHPTTVKTISDAAALRTLALGQLAASECQDDREVQKGLLGDFYDIEFLRIALDTLRGTPIAFTRLLFSELTATYLERLFDLCFRQAERERGAWITGRDRIGLFLSGGNARGRPYDEDYDLLAIVDSDDEALRRFTERVIVLLNTQIARRGIIPQHRLAEWFGHYVASVGEVRELLESGEDGLFVDRCQLLASRLVVGNRRIVARLEEAILRPCIFDVAPAFIRRVAQEVDERRRAVRTVAPAHLHLKEDRGGLRELDLALASAKARFGLYGTPGVDPFIELGRADPEHAALYARLARINDLLVALRSAYRVTISATATVEREYLGPTARILGCEGRAERSAADALFDEAEQALQESGDLIDTLIGDLLKT
jgi:hypothetical protein